MRRTRRCRGGSWRECGIGWSTETGYVHGPRGVANLVVAVPAGVEVTLLGSGKEVHIWGLRSCANLIGQRGKVRLEDFPLPRRFGALGCIL